MIIFPEHKGSLTLEHNDHLDCYETVKEVIDRCRHNNYNDENWVSLEEKTKAIETNELWSFLWHGPTRDAFRQLNASTLEALLGRFDIKVSQTKLPDHKASLTIVHNQHLGDWMNPDHQTVEILLWDDPNYYSDDDWVNLEEKEKAIKDNEIWTIQWYPDTPIGFCLRHASTLEVLLNSFKE